MSGPRLGVGGGGWGISDQYLNILRILETPTPIPHCGKNAGSAHMFAITIVVLHGICQIIGI